MRASSLAFPLAILMAIAGLGWGLFMGLTQDHSTLTAHAHLNLIGWVSLFLMGLFYRLHPALDARPLARLQVIVWAAGAVVLALALGLIYSGAPEADPLAGIASVVIFLDMLLFAWLALRAPIPARN